MNCNWCAWQVSSWRREMTKIEHVSSTWLKRKNKNRNEDRAYYQWCSNHLMRVWEFKIFISWFWVELSKDNRPIQQGISLVQHSNQNSMSIISLLYQITFLCRTKLEKAIEDDHIEFFSSRQGPLRTNCCPLTSFLRFPFSLKSSWNYPLV